jgi:hypothetical protein
MRRVVFSDVLEGGVNVSLAIIRVARDLVGNQKLIVDVRICGKSLEKKIEFEQRPQSVDVDR